MESYKPIKIEEAIINNDRKKEVYLPMTLYKEISSHLTKDDVDNLHVTVGGMVKGKFYELLHAGYTEDLYVSLKRIDKDAINKVYTLVKRYLVKYNKEQEALFKADKMG